MRKKIVKGLLVFANFSLYVSVKIIMLKNLYSTLTVNVHENPLFNNSKFITLISSNKCLHSFSLAMVQMYIQMFLFISKYGGPLANTALDEGRAQD